MKYKLEVAYYSKDSEMSTLSMSMMLKRLNIEAESELEARRKALDSLYSQGMFAKSIELVPGALA